MVYKVEYSPHICKISSPYSEFNICVAIDNSYKSRRVLVYAIKESNIEMLYCSKMIRYDEDREKEYLNQIFFVILREYNFNKYFTPQGIEYFTSGLDNNLRCMFGKPMESKVLEYSIIPHEQATIVTNMAIAEEEELLIFSVTLTGSDYYCLLYDNHINSVIAQNDYTNPMRVISVNNKKSTNRIMAKLLYKPESYKEPADIASKQNRIDLVLNAIALLQERSDI